MKYGRDLVLNDIVWSCNKDWGDKDDPTTLALLRENVQAGVVISEFERGTHDEVGLCVTGSCATRKKSKHGGHETRCWCIPVTDDTEYPESPEEAVEESISFEERYGQAIQKETSAVRAEMKHGTPDS